MVPDENRTFTTLEIADACGIAVQSVRNFANTYHYESLAVRSSNTGRCAIWDFNFYKAIKEVYERKAKEKEKRLKAKKEPEEENKTLEELKRLHPLVTDERCFKLSWFPETIPNNLADFV